MEDKEKIDNFNGYINNLSQKLVSVQPLSSPTGMRFYLRQFGMMEGLSEKVDENELPDWLKD